MSLLKQFELEPLRLISNNTVAYLTTVNTVHNHESDFGFDAATTNDSGISLSCEGTNR